MTQRTIKTRWTVCEACGIALTADAATWTDDGSSFHPQCVPVDDKFVSPSLPPEGIDRELLTILAEECCEVGQRVSKALRFGIDEVQPGQELTNAERIMQEIGDVFAVLDLLESRDIVNQEDIEKFYLAKMPKLRKFLQSS